MRIEFVHADLCRGADVGTPLVLLINEVTLCLSWFNIPRHSTFNI